MSIPTIPAPLSHLIALYLTALGIFVGLLFMFTPAFHNGSIEYPVWDVVNWFMIVATPLLLLINGARKSGLGHKPGKPVTREFLTANVAWYGTLALVIVTWWNFLFGQFPGNEVGLIINTHLNYYPLMEVAFALISAHAGIYLWNRTMRQASED